MIPVTRLDGSPMLLNIDLIVTIEQTPDTLISLSTSDRVIVRETPEELVTRIMQWKRDVARPFDSANAEASR